MTTARPSHARHLRSTAGSRAGLGPAQARAVDLHDGRPDVPGRSVRRAVRGLGARPGEPSPTLALATAAAGSLVILESWFTALGFLHRARRCGSRRAGLIFLAALVPWLVGLGVAVTVMLSLFWVSDRHRLTGLARRCSSHRLDRGTAMAAPASDSASRPPSSAAAGSIGELGLGPACSTRSSSTSSSSSSWSAARSSSAG